MTETVEFLLKLILFGYMVPCVRCVRNDTHFSVKIGMIRHGNGHIDIEPEAVHTCNVTYVWYSVNTTEIYQVYKAVHHFDTEHDVDFIVILEDLGTDDYLIYSRTVPLIKWGRTPSYILKDKEIVQLKRNYSEMCPIVSETTEEIPYCFDKGKVKDIFLHANNDTCFKSQVTPRGADILSLLITDRLMWTEVVIIHDSSTEMEAARLVDSLSINGIKTMIFNVDILESSRIDYILLEAYRRIVPLKSEINFVVLCKFNCLRVLFHKANVFDSTNTKTLLKHFSRWLVAAYDHNFTVSATLRECANGIDNVAIISLPEVTPEKTEKEFRRHIHDVVLELAFEYTASDEVGNSNESLNTTEATIKQEIIKELEKRAKSWRAVSKCEGYRVDTLLWTNGGRDFNNVGYISKNGEVVLYADLFPNTRYGYNGRLFQVSTLDYAPFVVREEVNGNVTYGGVCMELLLELARTLNFTYNITEPPDQTWGAPDQNMNFNGMIGQLQREEVDIVAADITIQKEREEVMDFMFPFYYGYTSVLLKKPDPNARKWRTLVDPFRWEVLMTIGICLPIASMLAFLLEKANPFYNDPENARMAAETYGLHTFHDSFWYMYGCLLCQGGVNLPESVAGRTFVSCWWLFSIVVVGTYCGNLIAFLTVTKDKPPFETLNEMADLKGEYRWGVQEGTNWEHVFKTSERQEFRRVGDALMEFNETDPSVFSKDFATQLANVKKGQYGWIGDTVVIEVEMAKDCELMMIKEKFLPLKYAFGFTNNSPHVQIFTKQLLSIHESGLLQVWKRKWWPKSKEICAGTIIAEAKPIAIVDVQSSFYVAAGGGFIGFCAFLIEVCIGQAKKRRQRFNGSIPNERIITENGTNHSTSAL